ncbi:MAG TPA: hypothetical protein VFA26_26135 [Gemmataceae bacterium]|nr:hypothetical protein [Gemmataceae bacterium]
MVRRLWLALLGGGLAAALWVGGPGTAQAQSPMTRPMNPFYYYPYYFFPHSYWPTMSPPWPGPYWAGYQRPPAYMAYPPFKEPHWRYEWWQPQRYHRGFHFWLDQF